MQKRCTQTMGAKAKSAGVGFLVGIWSLRTGGEGWIGNY